MSREGLFFDQDLGLAQVVEDLAIQELVAEPGVEAFAVPVLPGAAWFDVSGLSGSVLPQNVAGAPL